MTRPEPFNEQKVIYEFSHKLVRKLQPLCRALGVPKHRLGWGVYRQGNETELPHEYLMGWKEGSSKWKYQTRLTIDGLTYVDDDPIEGEAIVYDLPDDERNWSNAYDLKAIPVTDVIRESIKLHEETWEGYSAEATFNVTNRTAASASVSGGVDGIAEGEASVETETVVEAGGSFGTSGGQNKTREYTREVETTVHREDLRAAMDLGKSGLIVSVDVFKRKVVTPISERGIIEMSMVLDLYDWTEENRTYLRGGKDEKHNKIKFASFQDLIWFIEGQRMAEYPGMERFLGDMKWLARTKDDKIAKEVLKLYAWLKGKENRRVELAKERVRVYEFAGQLTTQFVG